MLNKNVLFLFFVSLSLFSFSQDLSKILPQYYWLSNILYEDSAGVNWTRIEKQSIVFKSMTTYEISQYYFNPSTKKRDTVIYSGPCNYVSKDDRFYFEVSSIKRNTVGVKINPTFNSSVGIVDAYGITIFGRVYYKNGIAK